MSLLQYISEGVIHEDFEEAKQYLIDNGIELGEELDYYVGSGAMGDVYKVKDKNKVIKIYEDIDEFKAIEMIMKRQRNKDMEYIAKYYFNRDLHENFICVIEFLEPLDIKIDWKISRMIKELESYYLSRKDDVEAYKQGDVVEQVINILLSSVSEGYRDEMRNDIKTLIQTYEKEDLYIYILIDINENLERQWGSAYAVDTIKFFNDNDKFIKDVFEGIKEFEELGFAHHDIHRGNILKDPKTNKYKIIDPLPYL